MALGDWFSAHVAAQQYALLSGYGVFALIGVQVSQSSLELRITEAEVRVPQPFLKQPTGRRGQNSGRFARTAERRFAPSIRAVTFQIRLPARCGDSNHRASAMLPRLAMPLRKAVHRFRCKWRTESPASSHFAAD